MTPPPARDDEAGTALPAAEVFQLDGEDVPFAPGDSVLAAAQRAGHRIPHLCWHPELGTHGSCRLCLVEANGRKTAACTTPAAAGMAVDSRTPALAEHRTTVLQMLFVEGNHFCPSCEKSGHCALQSAAYDAGMTGPHFEEFYPDRPVDASHPDVLLDFNRCILCELCVRASRTLDGKSVFAIGGHGLGAHLLVDSPSGRLGDSAFAATDAAASVCPVGVILPKRRGFAVPIGQRPVDLAAAAAEARDAEDRP